MPRHLGAYTHKHEYFLGKCDHCGTFDPAYDPDYDPTPQDQEEVTSYSGNMFGWNDGELTWLEDRGLDG